MFADTRPVMSYAWVVISPGTHWIEHLLGLTIGILVLGIDLLQLLSVVSHEAATVMQTLEPI